MKIKLTSIMVEDQDRALAFYTQVLGFKKKREFPAGAYRWITVAGKTFQRAMFDQGIPVAAFEVADIAAEFARLKAAGVAFTSEPARMGPVTIAIFSDTCGNLIQLYQPG